MNTEKNELRVPWVDYAKGICIVAVVSLYATKYVQGLAESDGWLQHWVDFAKPFRMPDFFLIAGLFLSRTIDRPWRTYLDRKVAHFVYFFALWTTFYFIAGYMAGEVDDGQPLWLRYLEWYVEPFHALWFIAMLPVYFVVTRLIRRVPWIVIFPLAALLQIWSPETDFRQFDRFGERYVYFYAGYVFAPLAFRLAGWAIAVPTKALGALAIWAFANEGLVLSGLADYPGFSLILGFAGAAAVIVCASLLSGVGWANWLRYLGKNSLIVFLPFFFFTVASARVILGYGWIADIGTQAVLVTLLSIAGPLLLYWAVRKTPLKFLFQRPRCLSVDREARPTLQIDARRTHSTAS